MQYVSFSIWTAVGFGVSDAKDYFYSLGWYFTTGFLSSLLLFFSRKKHIHYFLFLIVLFVLLPWTSIYTSGSYRFDVKYDAIPVAGLVGILVGYICLKLKIRMLTNH